VDESVVDKLNKTNHYQIYIKTTNHFTYLLISTPHV